MADEGPFLSFLPKKTGVPAGSLIRMEEEIEKPLANAVESPRLLRCRRYKRIHLERSPLPRENLIRLIEEF